MNFRISFLFVIVSVFMIFTIGFGSNFAEAKGPDEPCNYLDPHHYLKITADPLECKKVDYWVPASCGKYGGLYKTDSRCQPPSPGAPKTLGEQKWEEEQEKKAEAQKATDAKSQWKAEAAERAAALSTSAEHPFLPSKIPIEFSEYAYKDMKISVELPRHWDVEFQKGDLYNFPKIESGYTLNLESWGAIDIIYFEDYYSDLSDNQIHNENIELDREQIIELGAAYVHLDDSIIKKGSYTFFYHKYLAEPRGSIDSLVIRGVDIHYKEDSWRLVMNTIITSEFETSGSASEVFDYVKNGMIKSIGKTNPPSEENTWFSTKDNVQEQANINVQPPAAQPAPAPEFDPSGVIGAIVVGIIIIGIVVAVAKRKKKPAKQVINPPPPPPRSGTTTGQQTCGNCDYLLPPRKTTVTSIKCPNCGFVNNF